ncbi:MAG: hypothetical protein U0X87_16960 [Anaerolineales bacterium]
MMMYFKPEDWIPQPGADCNSVNASSRREWLIRLRGRPQYRAGINPPRYSYEVR